jgi:N-acetylglucosamine kinase-like BadF-type ATPase
VEDAARAIADTIHGALASAAHGSDIDAAVIGAAGAGRDTERKELEAALGDTFKLSTRIMVTTDAAIALEDAFGTSSGIVLNAGSGSIAYGRDPDGYIRRVGGLGWQFGDEGSGYALGRAALMEVGRALDGRSPPTSLTDDLREAIGARDVHGMIQWAQQAEPNDVAALAPAVAAAAAAGDPVAQRLIDECARDLTKHIAALLPYFEETRTVPVALMGGLLTPGTPVRASLEAMLEQELPSVSIEHDAVDPPRGALRLAARLIG